MCSFISNIYICKLTTKNILFFQTHTKCASNVVCDSLNFPINRFTIEPNCRNISDKVVQIWLYIEITKNLNFLQESQFIHPHLFWIGLGRCWLRKNGQEGWRYKRQKRKPNNCVARYIIWRNYKTAFRSRRLSNLLFFRTRNQLDLSLDQIGKQLRFV